MKDTAYAYCVARIRANEKKLLSKDDINSLINKKTFQEALIFLNEKGWLGQGHTTAEIVTFELESLWQLLNSCVPNKNELSVFCLSNDYFNIKAIVKAVLENTAEVNSFLFPTTIDVDKIKKTKDFSSFKYLGENYSEKAQMAYKEAVKGENGFFAEAIIDRFALEAFIEYAENSTCKLLREVYAFIADTAIIKTAYRCTKARIDKIYCNEFIVKGLFLDKKRIIDSISVGEDELKKYILTTKYSNCTEFLFDNKSEFEKWQRNEIFKLTEKASFQSFGFSPVVSYYFKKSAEIKKVRMILNCIKSGISKDIITERAAGFDG